MLWDLKNAQKIPKQGYLGNFFGAVFVKRLRYNRMLAKAESSVNRELDLVKFLQRTRLQTITTLA